MTAFIIGVVIGMGITLPISGLVGVWLDSRRLADDREFIRNHTAEVEGARRDRLQEGRLQHIIVGVEDLPDGVHISREGGLWPFPFPVKPRDEETS